MAEQDEYDGPSFQMPSPKATIAIRQIAGLWARRDLGHGGHVCQPISLQAASAIDQLARLRRGDLGG